MNKIKETSPDKVHGKLVKYRQGDCLYINYDGQYLAVLVSKKFNKYYDLTLLQYFSNKKPQLDDFVKGKVFGTRFGSWKHLTYAVNVRMLSCKYVDANTSIEKVGSITLIPELINDGYGYLDDIKELHEYYKAQVLTRIGESEKAEQFPELAFVGEHLIDMIHILE